MSVEQLTAQILREIHSPPTDAATPAQRLVASCCHATAAVGVSLAWCAPGSPPLTIAATDGVGAALDRLSFVLGEGPQESCLEIGRIVLRPDLEGGRAEWPGFVPEALLAGVRAAFAFPLRLGAISLGVLTVYRAFTGSLADDQLSSAIAHGAAATALLLDSPPGGDSGILPSILEDPFALQAEVHQATGMIAVQLGIALSTALSLLRAYAYSSDTPLESVARRVIARELFIT